MKDAATFSERLVVARNDINLSQPELAQKGGFSQRSVAAWEGAESEPSMENIIKLSGVLGVSVQWLLTGRHESRAETLHDKAAPYVVKPSGALREQLVSVNSAALNARRFDIAEDLVRIIKKVDDAPPPVSSKPDAAAAGAADQAAAEARRPPPKPRR